jgi:murein DD-endopeptidase MepM/ murein hydrolase activator NlpD
MAGALLLLTLPGAAPAAAEVEPTGSWPVRPRPAVVNDFDPPEVRWGSGHRGVDLAGRIGQQVRSALPGEVSFVGRIAGVGVVVVEHGTTRTTYQPVAASVSRGDPVAQGGVLGTLEWFGTHCLPQACLHWGLVEGDVYLDPLELVGGGPRPVRLLPVPASFLG